MYPLDTFWVNCLKNLNVSSMYPLGKCSFAPSVSPLEYADDIGQAASSEGAHSSWEPSEYFKPPTGAEVKVVVVPEIEELVEVTDRDAEESLVMSEVEREPAECNCTPATPVITEDVVMRLEDVPPMLLSADKEAPPSYLVSRQRCV